MRIKRFTAPDMRTALRMIREEQGPDAVILSNRATAGGIEVVAATDYDEALVAQALRAAAPGLEPVLPPAPVATMATTPARVGAEAPPTRAKSVAPVSPVGAASAAMNVAAPAHDQSVTTSAPAVTTHVRESLMSRARAVFKIGDGPTLAELTSRSAGSPTPSPAGAEAAQAPAETAMATAANTVAPVAGTAPAPTRFEAMMAALGSPVSETPEQASGDATAAANTNASPVAAGPAATAPTTTTNTSTPDETPAPAADETTIVAEPAAPRILRAVASDDAPPSDPTIAAMRGELARMRQLMETQMEQLSLERLRGSPARAAVFDALRRHGCEDTLAQAVAARIDPRLPPDEIREPMFAELARMLTVTRSEPIDDGGVIALVGPTGAGKTTTAAKLAARFAARHRARDVALVTADTARPGAREQLHAHGRRLGITVCEAAGPEGLQEALAQLVDYPLVLVDTTGHAPRDRALFGQILWLRASHKVRSLLVLPANAHPHDLGEVIRRYRPAAPEAVVLTKLDEAGQLGSALSVAVRHGLALAYTTRGQQVPSDIDAADADHLVHTLETSRRAADNPFAIEDRHAVV